MKTSCHDLRPDTAAAIVLNFNLARAIKVPAGAGLGGKPSWHLRETRSPGRKIGEADNVDLQSLIEDLLIIGFVPVSAEAVERHRNWFRLAVVFVPKGGDRKQISPLARQNIQEILDLCFWDVVIFRNPGENGGNFSVEARHPVLEKGQLQGSSSDLRALKGGFEIRTDGEELRTA